MTTKVGYTGGSTPDPTYQSLGDHTESIQIRFDPTVVTYDELLDKFWSFHYPMTPSYSTQYKSAVFYADESQKLAAEAKKAALEEAKGKQIYTEILPLETFYLAEAYHQKYRLRNIPLIASELEAQYPTLDAFLAAPSVTKINGFVSGCGSPDDLLEVIDSYGLSSEAADLLKEIVASKW